MATLQEYEQQLQERRKQIEVITPSKPSFTQAELRGTTFRQRQQAIQQSIVAQQQAIQEELVKQKELEKEFAITK